MDVYSFIAAAEENEENNMLVFLDIQKAYNTEKWRFIKQIRNKDLKRAKYVKKTELCEKFWAELIEDNIVEIYEEDDNF